MKNSGLLKKELKKLSFIYYHKTIVKTIKEWIF